MVCWTWFISPGEDPPQIATNTKWPPYCRKWKVYQNQPSGTFSNFTLYIRTLRKTIEINSNLYFFTIMKNISLFTTNMVYICFHTQYKIMWMVGWLITKLFEGLHTEICKFKGKYFSFHLTSRQCFPHNFVHIQQIWLVDGLNGFYRTAGNTFMKLIFWLISIVATPTPRISKLRWIT